MHAVPVAGRQDPAPTAVTLSGLAARWRAVRVTLLLHRAAAGAGIPGLAGRLRGALGHVLMESASAPALAGDPCSFVPACALDILFRPRPGVTPGLERPKPFVLRLLPQGQDLRIELILFGQATGLAGAVAEALTSAVPRTVTEGERRLPPVDDRWIDGVVPVDDLPAQGPVVLRLLSPLSLRRGQDQVGSFPALVSSLGNRVSGLALWHGLRVEADWQMLRDHAHGIRIMDHSLRRAAWTRTSGRQGGRRIPVRGLIGDIVLEGDLGPLRPLLAIGELCHAGSRSTLGMGQFTVIAAHQAE